MSNALARRTPNAIGAPLDLEALRLEAKRLVEPPHAKETRRRYSREVRDFEAFCAQIGTPSLPASDDAIILYLAHLKTYRTAGGIDSALTALSTWHKASGHDSPRGRLAVQIARENIRRALGAEPKKKAPLRVDMLRSAVEAIDTSTLLGKRDRAILLLGFAGAFRRSELAGLEIERLAFEPEGLLVRLRKSKTNQTGKKEQKAIPRDAPGDPVGAVRVWLEATGRTSGPLFPHVDRWGNVDTRGLDGGSIAHIVKRRLRAVGIDAAAYSGHSLRRGLLTEAAAHRKPRHKISAQANHRSAATTDGYIEDAEVWTDNAASGIGWTPKGE